MKDLASRRYEDPYLLLERALEDGWQDIDTIPIAGDGEFLVITIKGLVRLARNRKKTRIARRADGWGPKRTTVASVKTGNYIGAIAWKWPDDKP